jgi:hypothetical protein
MRRTTDIRGDLSWCEDGRVSRASYLRFRQPGAIFVAALIALVSSIPLAGARTYLLPLLLVPLVLVVWAWRAGTDVGRDGLRVRALLGSRMIRWTEVRELSADPRGRAAVLLTDGNVVRLTGVTAKDLPVVVAASGRQIDTA